MWRSWVSLKFAVTQRSSSETSVSRFWPGGTFWLISTLLRVMMPSAGATILAVAQVELGLVELGLRLLHLRLRLLGARVLRGHLLRTGLRILLQRLGLRFALVGDAHAVLRRLLGWPAHRPARPWPTSAAATAASYCCLLITSFSTSGL